MDYKFDVVKAINNVFVRYDDDYCDGLPERYVDIKDLNLVNMRELADYVSNTNLLPNSQLIRHDDDYENFVIKYKNIDLNIRLNLYFGDDSAYNIKEIIITPL